jgi:proteic killer suppression protein
MIKSYGHKSVRALFEDGRRLKSLPTEVQQRAVRKLQMLHAARQLSDLRVPLSNRLETLKGDRLDQHSIRINKQYRICFVWRNGNAHDVEIVDYH